MAGAHELLVDCRVQEAGSLARFALKVELEAGGRYRLEGLPPGRYVIVAEPDGAPPHETTVDLVEREERALDLST